MLWKYVWFLIITWSSGSKCLVCYNCSTMFRDWTWCGGDFAPTDLYHFNTSRSFLVNCTGHNAMCFVRAWSTRAHHSWLVQRGCYQPVSDDPLARSLNIPTRAMTCKHDKLYESGNTDSGKEFDISAVRNMKDEEKRFVREYLHVMHPDEQRYPEADYKVCLCQADWCNSGSNKIPFFQTFLKFFINLWPFI